MKRIFSPNGLIYLWVSIAFSWAYNKISSRPDSASAPNKVFAFAAFKIPKPQQQSIRTLCGDIKRQNTQKDNHKDFWNQYNVTYAQHAEAVDIFMSIPEIRQIIEESLSANWTSKEFNVVLSEPSGPSLFTKSQKWHFDLSNPNNVKIFFSDENVCANNGATEFIPHFFDSFLSKSQVPPFPSGSENVGDALSSTRRTINVDLTKCWGINTASLLHRGARHTTGRRFLCILEFSSDSYHSDLRRYGLGREKGINSETIFKKTSP